MISNIVNRELHTALCYTETHFSFLTFKASNILWFLFYSFITVRAFEIMKRIINIAAKDLKT